jgi:hypothetical protein
MPNLRALVGASLAGLAAAQDWGTTGSWSQIQPSGATAGPSQFISHNPATIQGQVIFIGMSSTGANTSWSYDIIANSWTSFPNLPVTINYGFTFSTGGDLIVVDETNPNSLFVSDSANPNGGWITTSFGTSGPEGRIGNRFMPWGSILYMFGGLDSTLIHNDIWAVDLQSALGNPTVQKQWVRVTADGVNGVPDARIAYSWTAFGAHTIIMGGVTPPVGGDPFACIQPGNTCIFHRHVWSFAPGNRGLPGPDSVTGTAFLMLADAGAYGGPVPSGRFLHAAGATGDQLYIYGGITAAGFVNDLWAYNLVSQTWAQVKSAGGVWPNSPISGAGAMIARAFYVYVTDGAAPTLWKWVPDASSGANPPAPQYSDPPHPGTVAGLTIGILIGLGNLVLLYQLLKRSSGGVGSSFTGSTASFSGGMGDVYTAVPA